MLNQRRIRRKSTRTLLPVIVLILLVILAGLAWLAYATTHPPTRAYLITPERFTQLSEQGLRATDETWTNSDGTQARGWLLRGAEGAPAVLMLHAYGRDRSSFLNLGVKLNEATNFTVLWTDARAHGENPLSGASSFGARETADALDALKYLRELKTPAGAPLVGGNVGIYGVEMGAYTALAAATKDASVRALVLDSPLAQPGDLLRSAIHERTGINTPALDALATLAARIYLLGKYDDTSACDLAHQLMGNVRVLLLSGADAGKLRDTTTKLAECFPINIRIELNTQLPLTGIKSSSATGIESESYDRRVIDFFDRTLRDE